LLLFVYVTECARRLQQKHEGGEGSLVPVQKCPSTYWIERMGSWPQGKEPLQQFFMKVVNGGICLGVLYRLACTFEPPQIIHEGWCQWRTQEFCSGRFSKFSWGQRTKRTGIWGR